MKIPGAITIAVITAATAGAAPQRVAVCSEIGNGFVIAKAQSIAGAVYSTIGVRIDWHRPASCPADAIHIDYSYQTPPDFKPEALAYALPYEGIHIVLFYDRIQKQHRPEQFSRVLGHVMAHEIAHILEGVNRHSESGIMKATWTIDDYSAMAFHPLAFADQDVVLIHKGVEVRESRMVALR